MELLKVKILDATHFYYGDYLVDLPSILYEIIPLHDGKTAHKVSTAFTIIQNEVSGYGWFKPRHLEIYDNSTLDHKTALNPKLIAENLKILAKCGIKGTPFNIRGELLA